MRTRLPTRSVVELPRDHSPTRRMAFAGAREFLHGIAGVDRLQLNELFSA